MEMKKVNWRRFALIGIYLSMAAALAAFSLYVLRRQFDLTVQISLGCVVIGLAIFAILDPDRVRAMATGRQARYGSNAFVLSLAVIGILCVLNILAYNHSKRWDITQGSQHTLAPETLQALKNLSQTVTAKAFYTNRIDSSAAKAMLEDYRASSNGKFIYKFINPESDPVTAIEANVTQDGTIVLELGQYKEKINNIREPDITNAIIRLSNPGERAVYFLTGHGELDLSGTADRAFSQVKLALENKNYKVKQLNLMVDQQVPQDALSIIIAGPQKPITIEEVKLLKDYVDKGNSLVIMEQPTPFTQFGDSPDPLADYLIQDWGITLGNDVVIDLSSYSNMDALANEYGNHVITSQLGTMASVFHTARSTRIKTMEGITQTVLVKTSSRSWAETNLVDFKNNRVVLDKSQDLIGPVPLVAAAENSVNQSRVVVFGDSDFASDQYFNTLGNGDLIINAIDWSAKQDKLINLTPKQVLKRSLIPPKTYSLGLIFLGTVVALPGLVILMGIVVGIQRKRQG
jgi:ABC-type uncharacterized transport system involved in gliding motility auxiliary subunit